MTATAGKSANGQMAYHAGLSAEDCVSSDYERRGFSVGWRRWRGTAGEIDLIARDGDGFIFIEVKKSRSFDRAVQRVSPRQMQRIYAAGEEFLGQTPRGTLTNVRFDVALVNDFGEVKIIENAFGHG